MSRERLPDRRPAETREFEFDGQRYYVTVGFLIVDDEWRPREIFVRTGREGSALSRILDDASVAISLALQNGVRPAAMARSISRLPAGPVAPADLDRPEGSGERRAASVIGAALDLLVEYEDAA